MKKVLRFALLIALSLLSIVLCFGVGELVARMKYKPRKVYFSGSFEYHPIKKIALKKNYVGPDDSGNAAIITNSMGFRSAEIHQKKQPNELRFAFIGDSITYGHGVKDQDRFSNIFELNLTQACAEHLISTINTGVPGYSIKHEYQDLLSISHLQPDVVFLQFTLNDLTEPFNFEKRLGGSGIDYHRVADTSFWHFYLSQRSALYLLANDLSKQIRFGTKNDTDIQQKAIAAEIMHSTELINHPNDARQEKYWEEYLFWFDKFIQQCNKTNTACILVMSPYTFQLSLPLENAYPQKRLEEHARSKGMTVINLLPVFQEIIQKEIAVRYNLEPNTPIEHLYEVYRVEFNEIIQRYFLDHDHYAPQGHAVVANTLMDATSYMCSNN